MNKEEKKRIFQLWLNFVKASIILNFVTAVKLVKTTFEISRKLRTLNTEEEVKELFKAEVGNYMADGIKRALEPYNKLDNLAAFVFSKQEPDSSEILESLLKAIPKDRMPKA